MVLSRYGYGQDKIKLPRVKYRILTTQDKKETINKNLMWYV